MLKKLTKNPFVHSLICATIAAYLKFVRATTIWEIEGTEDRDRIVAEGRPFLIALWHNRIGMMPFAHYDRPYQACVVASAHKDGRFVIDTMARFNFSGVPVDSKAGAVATRSIVKKLKAGESVGITPDGPRGPRLTVKDGLVVIAALSGAPIMPVTYSLKRRLVLKTWDRFVVPLPFNRGICRWGGPIEVPARSSAETREETRLELEEKLNALTDDLDREMGHTAIDRADAEPERGTRE